MTTRVAGHEITLDEEGFMTNPDEWTEEIAATLAAQIDIQELTEDHWKVIRFLREDYAAKGETANLRRVSTVGGVPTKQLFQLFPKKPGKKMAYVSGLPKPKGCI